MKNNSVQKFLQKLGMVGAGAAVFGLVAGGTFVGVNKLTTQSTEPAVAAVESVATPQTEVADTEDSGGTKLLTTTTGSAAAAATDGSIAEVAAEVMPSIVAITAVSESEYLTMFGQRTGQTYESEAAGSGIIVAQDDTTLYIATNNHVVTGSTALTVEFSDGSTAPAEIRGTDSKNDLAVVEVELSELSDETLAEIRVATLGDSDEIQVGETAIAIGNALGYGQSVTTGIISATNREVESQDATTGEEVTATLLQTDAAINPGNSGGALLNAAGAVIGINSAKYSDTAVEGMGFAIPINTAKEIIEAIIDGTLEEKQLQAGYLGISGIDIDEEDASKFNMPQGVYIAQVADDSAAAQAGLKKGQIITKVNDTEITSATQLAQVITSYQGGDIVTVTLATADNGAYVESTVNVVLGTQAEKESAAAASASASEESNAAGGAGTENYGSGSEAPDGSDGSFSGRGYGAQGGSRGGRSFDESEQYGSQQDDGETQYYYGDFGDLGELFEQFMR